MFRNGLLLSTAMTAVAFLLSGAPTGAHAQTGMHAAPPDANTRFLCTYGQFAVTHSQHTNSSSGQEWYYAWTHVAVRVTGRGQIVSEIIVKEEAETSRTTFSAGIYSDANGEPGNLIAGGSGTPPSECGNVTIPITPTTLANNTIYWVEESADRSRRNMRVYWAVNPKTKKKAYVQHHFSSSNFTSQGFHSSTTPWEKQSSGPWFRLR